ncbi:MAG: WHG domain-containing protein [Alicyclobacillus sp.]|nr:WHG domain-containing protein [Alicyclobacillus sp.]
MSNRLLFAGITSGKSGSVVKPSKAKERGVEHPHRPGHAPASSDLQMQAASQAVIDTVLTVLQPYKLSSEDTIHVIRGFRAIGHGFATLELAGAFGIDVDTNQSYERLISAFLHGLRRLRQEAPKAQERD